jgi:ABC-2 type transport system ATP-binding protein
MSVFAVEAVGLHKHFGATHAVRGLTMRVPQGAFFAFLGPNGAGKSTTISLLTQIYAPDAGQISILGVDAVKEPTRAKQLVGVVPEELALFERLTGQQYLTFCARMHGVAGPLAQARSDELLSLTELDTKKTVLVQEYSKGMRRRLAIAAAVIHAPRVLFLDEPFEGIDVLAGAVIRAMLLELKKSGVTVLLTTHILEIADRLATHAGIIFQGQLIEEGEKAALLSKHDTVSLEGVFEKCVGVPKTKGVKLSFV